MKHVLSILLVLLAISFSLNGVQCQTCTPNFCDEVKIKCKEVICEADEVFHRRGGGLCGCCPICTKSTSVNHGGRCNPNFCDNIKVKCVAVECGPDEVALVRPELCRCCPACYPKKRTPCA